METLRELFRPGDARPRSQPGGSADGGDAPGLDLDQAARALGEDPDRLRVALERADLSPRELGRAVRDGDPHGDLPRLAAALDRPVSQLALDLADAVGASDASSRGLLGDLDLDADALADLLDASALEPLVDDVDLEGIPAWLQLMDDGSAALADRVARVRRWQRGLAWTGGLLAVGAVAAGLASMLAPVAARAVLWHALTVGLVVGGVGLFAAVVGLSGFVHGHLSRVERAAEAVDRAPLGTAARVARRTGLDRALRERALEALRQRWRERDEAPPGDGPGTAGDPTDRAGASVGGPPAVGGRDDAAASPPDGAPEVPDGTARSSGSSEAL